jgi:hypothetical protein
VILPRHVEIWVQEVKMDAEKMVLKWIAVLVSVAGA